MNDNVSMDVSDKDVRCIFFYYEIILLILLPLDTEKWYDVQRHKKGKVRVDSLECVVVEEVVVEE